jgi:hypothetical protein
MVSASWMRSLKTLASSAVGMMMSDRKDRLLLPPYPRAQSCTCIGRSAKHSSRPTDDGLIPHNAASPVKPPHSTIAGAQTLYGAQDIRNMLLEIITPWSLATSRNIKAVPTDVSPVTVPTRV